jgi:DNA-binding transcriptional regulator YiaG
MGIRGPARSITEEDRWQMSLNLVTIRQKLDLTQRELAEMLGTNRDRLGTWERGIKYPHPKFRQIIKDLRKKLTQEGKL